MIRQFVQNSASAGMPNDKAEAAASTSRNYTPSYKI